MRKIVKAKAIIIIALCLLSSDVFYAQKYAGEFSECEFHMHKDKLDNMYEVIETRNKLIDFFDIKKGDVVADIGSEDGVAIGILSTLVDSVIFYAQDINAKALSQKRVDQTMATYSKYRKTKQTNTVIRVIGTETESKLPNGLFDKIIIRFSFHDFDKKDEMLSDLYTKLKPDGQLIIDDGNSFVGDTLVCRAYGCHKFLTFEEELTLFAKHRLYVTRMRNPNFHAAHYGNVLVFEKNKAKSDLFFERKNAVDAIVSECFKLNKNEIASDSVVVKQITETILPKISDIALVYEEYDVWLNSMALKFLRKSMFQSAINILKMNTRLYPNTYQGYYWLGVAYQENKQYELAGTNFKQSLSVNSDNANALIRLKEIEKQNH